MIIPVPRGTSPTIFPSGAKLSVLLCTIELLKTRTSWPPCCGNPGKSKTKIPPVLSSAVLS